MRGILKGERGGGGESYKGSRVTEWSVGLEDSRGPVLPYAASLHLCKSCISPFMLWKHIAAMKTVVTNL